MADAKAILDECGMNAKHPDPRNLKNPNQPAPRAKNMPENAHTGECVFNSFPSDMAPKL